MQISISSSFLFFLATSTAAKLEGGYINSCLEVRLDDNGNPQDLTGDCHSNTGQYTRKTRLDLNLCYSVDPETCNITAQDGGPGLNNSNINFPCEKCFNGNGYELPINYYACDCPPDPYVGGLYKHSGVDMNELITNEDGFLKCFNHTAVFLSEFPNF